ncbi:hypothetical protein [Rhodoferax sp.]|nr:hypothetical protein [Rhodoferax sp.]
MIQRTDNATHQAYDGTWTMSEIARILIMCRGNAFKVPGALQ